MRKLLLAATAAAAIAVPAAAVTTYDFSLVGTYSATWSMPASRTPDSNDDELAAFDGITFTRPDASTKLLRFEIYSGPAGGIRIEDPSSGGLYRGRGAEIYTGTLAAPTFKTGTFILVNFSDVQNGTLTISRQTSDVVPEPASWAMLIAGFGLTGTVMRRRRAGALTA